MSDFALVADALAVAQVRAQTITAYDVATTYKVHDQRQGRLDARHRRHGHDDGRGPGRALNASTVSARVPGDHLEQQWRATLIGTCDTAGKSITFALTRQRRHGHGRRGQRHDGQRRPRGPDGQQLQKRLDRAPARCRWQRRHAHARSHRQRSEIQPRRAVGRDGRGAVHRGQLHRAAGPPPVNTDGDTITTSIEPQYLLLGATVCLIGDGDGDGSDLMMIDCRASLSGVTVLKTGSSPRSTAWGR
jgi:hypothetical protein